MKQTVELMAFLMPFLYLSILGEILRQAKVKIESRDFLKITSIVVIGIVNLLLSLAVSLIGFHFFTKDYFDTVLFSELWNPVTVFVFFFLVAPYQVVSFAIEVCCDP